VARVVGVEVGIVRRSGPAMMVQVLGQQRIVGESGIEAEREPADGAVHARAARRERAVHGVVGDDEKPDVQPADGGDEQRRGQRTGEAQRVREDRIRLKRYPAEHDGDGEAEADRALARDRHGADRWVRSRSSRLSRRGA